MAQALSFLRRGGCVPITASASVAARSLAAPQQLLQPDRPTAAQRAVPGLY